MQISNKKFYDRGLFFWVMTRTINGKLYSTKHVFTQNVPRNKVASDLRKARYWVKYLQNKKASN